jgi:hypothetical protein
LRVSHAHCRANCPAHFNNQAHLVNHGVVGVKAVCPISPISLAVLNAVLSGSHHVSFCPAVSSHHIILLLACCALAVFACIFASSTHKALESGSTMYLSTAQNIGLAILAHRLGNHVADCTNHHAIFCVVVG